MERKQLTEALSVGPQIGPADFAELKAAGFRSVICNRPDGESADQPRQSDMARAAGKAGLEFRYIPVTPSSVNDKTAAEFAAAMAELPGPVFAYCRSGMRSATLWSLSEARNRPSQGILGRLKSRFSS